MSYLNLEQLRADIGRWKREIQNERTQRKLTDEHPNISRRLSRIRVAENLLDAHAPSPDHTFRSLHGAQRCVVIIGALGSGLMCRLLPNAHQDRTVTSPKPGGAS